MDNPTYPTYPYRGLLHAPRVKGDLNLGDEFSRVVESTGGIRVPEWAVIDTPGGLLPGGAYQDIYTDTAAQNYRLGTRRVIDDRVFKYCHAQEALNKFLGAYNHSQWPINANLITQATVGDSSILLPLAGAGADDYAGGWIVFFGAPGGLLQMRRILGNDASVGNELLAYLDGPMEVTCAAGTWCTGYPHIYDNVRCPPAPDPDYTTFVCIPWIEVVNGRYFWGQTWGPCYGVAGHTVPGSTASNRWVFFSTAGNLISNADGNVGAGQQMAGFLLPRTSFGVGDQLYMLTLSP